LFLSYTFGQIVSDDLVFVSGRLSTIISYALQQVRGRGRGEGEERERRGRGEGEGEAGKGRGARGEGEGKRGGEEGRGRWIGRRKKGGSRVGL
jgi:hypothetical protein